MSKAIETRLQAFRTAEKSGREVLASIETKIAGLQKSADLQRQEILANGIAAKTCEVLLKDIKESLTTEAPTSAEETQQA